MLLVVMVAALKDPETQTKRINRADQSGWMGPACADRRLSLQPVSLTTSTSSHTADAELVTCRTWPGRPYFELLLLLLIPKSVSLWVVLQVLDPRTNGVARSTSASSSPTSGTMPSGASMGSRLGVFHDTGAPGESSDFTTLVILHGHNWHGGTQFHPFTHSRL